MGDHYRPPGRDDGPPRMPRAAEDAIYHFRGNHDEGRRGRPAERHYRPRRNDYRRPAHMSERPLLTQKHDAAELQAFRDPQATDKFRNPAELTDSEEDEMIESEDELHAMPPPKKPKTSAADEPPTSSVPKWSNPDPYTALPPPTETTGKGFDVVKLIRKAKIFEAAKKTEQDFKHNDDFISFDGLNDLFPDAPTGPSADRLGKRKRGQEEALPRPPDGYQSRQDDTVLRQWQIMKQDDSIPWHTPCQPEDTASMALHKEIIDFYEWVRPKEYDIEVRRDVITRLSLAFNRIESGEVKPFGSFAAGLYLPIGDMDLVFLQRSFRPGVYGPNGLPEKPKRKLMEKFAKLLRDQQIARPGTVQLIPFAKVPIIKFVDSASGLKVDLCFNNDTGVTANETVQTWKSNYSAMPILVSIVKQFLMIRGLNDVAVGGLGGFSVICLVTSLIQHLPTTGSTLNLGQFLVEFFNLYGNLIDHEAVAIRLDPPAYLDKTSYKPFLFNNDKRNRLAIVDPNRPENNVSGGSSLIEQILDSFAGAHDILQEHLEAFATQGADRSAFSFLKDLVGGNFASYAMQRKALQGLYFGLTGREASEPVIRRCPVHQNEPPQDPSTRKGKRLPNINSQTQTRAQNAKTNGIVHDGDVLLEVDFDSGSGESGNVAPSRTQSSKSERRAARLKLARPELASRIGSSISLKAAVQLGGFANGPALADFLKEAQSKPQSKQHRFGK